MCRGQLCAQASTTIVQYVVRDSYKSEKGGLMKARAEHNEFQMISLRGSMKMSVGLCGLRIYDALHDQHQLGTASDWQ